MHARLTEVLNRTARKNRTRVTSGAETSGALCIGNFKSQLGNNLWIDSYYYKARVFDGERRVRVYIRQGRRKVSSLWPLILSFLWILPRLCLAPRSTWLAREEFYFRSMIFAGEIYATCYLKFKNANLFTLVKMQQNYIACVYNSWKKFLKI